MIDYELSDVDKKIPFTGLSVVICFIFALIPTEKVKNESLEKTASLSEK
jgi:preprotein translocase subunit SecY